MGLKGSLGPISSGGSRVCLPAYMIASHVPPKFNPSSSPFAVMFGPDLIFWASIFRPILVNPTLSS